MLIWQQSAKSMSPWVHDQRPPQCCLSWISAFLDSEFTRLTRFTWEVRVGWRFGRSRCRISSIPPMWNMFNALHTRHNIISYLCLIQDGVYVHIHIYNICMYIYIYIYDTPKIHLKCHLSSTSPQDLMAGRRPRALALLSILLGLWFGPQLMMTSSCEDWGRLRIFPRVSG